MVGARNPESVKALHTFETDYDVLKSFIKCVTEMELTCDIGRRYHNCKRRFATAFFRCEISFFTPVCVELVFKITRIILFVKFFHCINYPFRFL